MLVSPYPNTLNEHTRSPSFQNQLPLVSIGEKVFVVCSAPAGLDMIGGRMQCGVEDKELEKGAVILDCVFFEQKEKQGIKTFL